MKPAVLLLSCAALLDAAENFAPYEPDYHTLHLWHFEEKTPPFADSSRVNAHPLLGLFNNARGGEESLPGLGRSVFLHANAGGTPGEASLKGGIVTLASLLAQGKEDNAPPDFRLMGEDGAFTYEALVRLEQMPADAQVIALGLMSLEGDESSRVFNFRIEREGFLAFTPLIDGGALGGAMATIPTTGRDAINTQDWFHVAVTYSGEDGVIGNLRMYWTRLDGWREEANFIGSGTLSSDFNGIKGDFAIGNEARSFNGPGNAEAEPFPGFIDEVRISSVARNARDFLVTPAGRRSPSQASTPNDGSPGNPRKPRLTMSRLSVDGTEVALDGPEETASLRACSHQLDFEFGFPGPAPQIPSLLRCQLEGFEKNWRDTGQGMSLTFQLLDEGGQILSQEDFPARSTTTGWNNVLEESTLTGRSETLLLPPGAKSLRIILSSGPPDTTGTFAIDSLALRVPGIEESILDNGEFEGGEHLSSPAGLPDGWSRGGTNPAIAQVRFVKNSIAGGEHSLVLVDSDQSGEGVWTTTFPLAPDLQQSGSLVATWQETSNVISGTQYRATYLNVPPGNYTFRVIAALQGGGATEPLDLPIRIPLPVAQRPWFWPAIIAGLFALALLYTFDHFRRLHRRRLRAAEFESRLAHDRARIAQDLHDDLGTRVTVINMAASLARQNFATQPEKAHEHLAKVTTATRELVTAMDELVWTVDPRHDHLEHLASHLMRLAEDLFTGSEIRCRTDIPADLPDHTLLSDYRHNLTLAVKEALHNALKHSAARQVILALSIDEKTLAIAVADDGTGFHADKKSRGHGLANLHRRLSEIGGICTITSQPGEGTTVTFRSPLDSATPA